jgi:hypothetical protein
LHDKKKWKYAPSALSQTKGPWQAQGLCIHSQQLDSLSWSTQWDRTHLHSSPWHQYPPKPCSNLKIAAEISCFIGNIVFSFFSGPSCQPRLATILTSTAHIDQRVVPVLTTPQV